MGTVLYRSWQPDWVEEASRKLWKEYYSLGDPEDDFSEEDYDEWLAEHAPAKLKKYWEYYDGLGDEGEVYAPENPYRTMSYELSEEFLDILERAGTEYHPVDEMSVEEFDAWIYAQTSEELKAFLDKIAKSDA